MEVSRRKETVERQVSKGEKGNVEGESPEGKYENAIMKPNNFMLI